MAYQGRGRAGSQSSGQGGRPNRGGGGAPRGGGPPPAGQPTQMAVHGSSQATRPDQAISEAEDALVKATAGAGKKMFPFVVKEPVEDTGDYVDVTYMMPWRTGYGSAGRKTTFQTNYFKLNTGYEGTISGLLDKELYRYDIGTTPAELSRPKRRRLVEVIVNHTALQGKVWATDYAKILVTTEPLELTKLGSTPGNVWKDKIVIPAPKGNTGHGTGAEPSAEAKKEVSDSNAVDILIQSEGVFKLKDIIDYQRSSAAGGEFEGLGDVNQLLNIIMCKKPQDHPYIVRVGQGKFYPFGPHPAMNVDRAFQLGGGLEAVRGYYSSVRPTISRLLVNMNVTAGAFYKPIPLITLLRETGLQDLKDQEAFIRLLKVRVDYVKKDTTQPFMVKIKTIFGFAQASKPGKSPQAKRFGDASNVFFSLEDRNHKPPTKSEVDVYNYYWDQHKIELKGFEPVLNVGNAQNPQYVPQEMCTVLPGQPYRRILAGDQTSTMIKFAARRPDENRESITSIGLRIFDPSVIKDFGVSLDTKMITVPGRVLDAPSVTYANGGARPQFGSWNLQKKTFVKGAKIEKWQVLIINRDPRPRGNALFDSPRDGRPPAELINELGRILQLYGVVMGTRLPTQTIQLQGLTKNNRQANDNKVEGAFNSAAKQNVKMLFVVLPEADRWLYARIKLHGDVEYGIHSICAVGSKLQKDKGQDMYMGNLALKFNIKAGGITHTIPNVFMDPLDKNTMLVGLDVTHPSPGSSANAPSIAAVVASTDEHLCQWPGSIRRQKGRQEMVQELREMVLERLDLWAKKHNGTFPSKIVVYRDGVSEGQYPLVLKHELPAFEAAFKERYASASKWPKMSIIIVGKRHHTRFYPISPQDADNRSGNPVCGTIVDRGIAGKVLQEFWLQAHHGLQGTAKPAHYVVIKDDIGFTADALQQFTHRLCYLFNRATKAVSICPPAYYADLLCERGRAYLFSVLAENNAVPDDNVSVSSAGSTEWSGGVHENLKASTWYI